MTSGYRLLKLEVFNWGTFDGTIWPIELDGHSCLLTGQNGSGKSTLIDAFLSLLVPNKRRSYNMSSGSEKRERNETTYVRGAYQREKNRLDQIQVKYLRDEQSLSALAAHFENPLTKDQITLAQFFWFESGDLRKCLVISHHSFSLKALLQDVKSPADLRLNLKKIPHTTIFQSFNEYQEYFVRYVGLRSYKGMDLFNQVSTIKQIGNLNEFVRQNMLEDVDMEPFLHDFFHTFEDLTLAHQAIINAKRQIENLDGIDKDAKKFSDTAQKLEQTTRLQTYIPRYFSAQQYETLTKQQQELTQQLVAHQPHIQAIEQHITHAQDQLSVLTQNIDGQNGEARLRAIHRELTDAKAMQERSQTELKKLDAIRQALGFKQTLTPEQFAKEQLDLPSIKKSVEEVLDQQATQLFSLKQEEHQLKEQLQTLAQEVLSTQKNKTLIPHSHLELRRFLCDALHLNLSEVPYAAELMAVKEEESEWRLAAEKLLRPLALKLLVPESHFMEANQFLRSRNIGMKIVLQCINLTQSYQGAPLIQEQRMLIAKLAFHPKATQVGWLKQQIREHFSYQCVNDMREFQAASRAVTIEGLIKRNTHISEKDDRTMSHAQYLLGWAHEDKLQRLIEDSLRLKAQLQNIQKDIQLLVAKDLALNQQLSLLAQRQLFDSFDTVDSKKWALQIQELQTQRQTMMKQTETKEINLLQQERDLLAKNRDEAIAKAAVLRNELEKIPTQLNRLEILLNTLTADEELDERLQQTISKIIEKTTVTAELEGRIAEMLRADSASLSEAKQHLGISLVRKMTSFKAKFPEISTDLDASLEFLPSFLNKYQVLKKEDLPKNEARFKTLISKNIITDLTAFKSTLELNAEQIKENIEQLNTSLKHIAYTNTSYVQIRMVKTKSPDIREFQAMLRNAVQMKRDQNDVLDLEESFQRIRTIIMHLKNDMKWSKRVTDVRNWTDFFVVELSQSTHEEVSFYSDSSGLSGGQKAKLAFTILASALAYQYGIHSDTALEKSFRFVVIDEAFSKSDDSNSQYALELFKQLGLQLLVVTPMDKLTLIKPYVQRIFITQIPQNSHRSQLATMKTLAMAEEDHGQ